ncbi:uncharacterized protein LOC111087515 [Limulus polyphemus]|uniref:Uncharacterized protein LOC111087515 n=1 Tax=Limulus polyphemus TaxID=6850 RepID=A0ABM1T2J0_LIMPO|nr:uncharacterized protein LOC111087515 [Limulus polyphemus]
MRSFMSLICLISLINTSIMLTKNGMFILMNNGFAGPSDALLKEITVSSKIQCAVSCLKITNCLYAAMSSPSDNSDTFICQLLKGFPPSSMVAQIGWSLYTKPENHLQKTYYGLDPYDALDNNNDDYYEMFCSSNSLFTGIWEDSEEYWDIDLAKCMGLGNIPVVDTSSGVQVEIYRPPSYVDGPRECPNGYVITGTHDNSDRFSSPNYVQCSPLVAGWSVDYSDCNITIRTTQHYYGPTEPDETWNYECSPDTWFVKAMVGMELLDDIAIKCCTIYRSG